MITLVKMKSTPVRAILMAHALVRPKTRRGRTTPKPMKGATSSMTPDEFRNAIRKGQGRVIQCLQRQGGEPFVDLIEHACNHHLAFDPQCEGSRENYMTEIAEFAGGLKRFRDSILTSLKSTESYWDASQLFGLANRLAVQGDRDARDVMYARFRKAVHAKVYFPGDLDIIELDGRNGLRAVAAAFGEQCLSDPEYRPNDVRWFTSPAFAEGDVETALSQFASQDPAIRAYLDRLQAGDAKSTDDPAEFTDEILGKMSFADFALRVLDSGDARSWSATRRWSEVAPDGEIRAAANALAVEADAERMKLLVQVFRWRPCPLDPSVLLRKLKDHSGNSILSRRIEVALQLTPAPSVRTAALSELEPGGDMARGLYLLAANYLPVDSDLIVSSLPNDDEDADAIHNICHGLLDVFDDDRIADGTEVFAWMWEHSPCAICRERAFLRLDSIDCVSDRMRQEAMFDCNPELRAAALGQELEDGM